MTKDEALDLALAYIQEVDYGPYDSKPVITAIKQARALDKMADNARELGLDYEPADGTQVSKVWWDGEKLMAKPIPLEDIYQPEQEPVALRPEDVTVEVLMVQSGGGFAPLKTHGVKLTHKPTGIVVQCSSERSQHRNREQALRDLERYLHGARPQPTPPAQPAPVQEPDHGDELTIAYMSGLHDGKKLAAQPAVPDAIHHTDLSEHPQYIEGWNDCRAEMLKGMKP